jgi:hypothetical protein
LYFEELNMENSFRKTLPTAKPKWLKVVTNRKKYTELRTL